jgi:hypothetical protein
MPYSARLIIWDWETIGAVDPSGKQYNRQEHDEGIAIGKNKRTLRLEWHPVEYERGWMDVFVYRISATDGLPPAAQAKIIEAIAKNLSQMRFTATLHVIVESKGNWFVNELNRLCQPTSAVLISLDGGRIGNGKYVEHYGSLWAYLEPPLFELARQEYPTDKRAASKLRILRILARLSSAQSVDLSSLSGYSKVYTIELMKELEFENLVMRSTVGKYAGWEITRRGIRICHESWNLPPKMRFTKKRREHNYSGWRHRRTSRMWPYWLRKSWGRYIELWECWTEAYLKPSGYPDALAWGKYLGEEVMFWLEVDTGHTGYEKLIAKYNRRIQKASGYGKIVGMKIIFVILSPRWVVAHLRFGLLSIPDNIAMISHDWASVGKLPIPLFGRAVAHYEFLNERDRYRNVRHKGGQLPFDPQKYRK